MPLVQTQPIPVIVASLPGKGQTLVVDADAPLQSLLDAPRTPRLLQNMLKTGEITWQIRNETTVSASLRSAPAVAPWLAALYAWGGALVMDDDSQRDVSAFLSQSARVPKGFSVLHIPLQSSARAWGESHVSITPADRPIVLAVAVLDWEGGAIRQAKIAMTGVARNAFSPLPQAKSLIGKTLDDAAIQAFARETAAALNPIGDFRGSAEYRRAMAEVTLRRALTQALQKGDRA